MNKYKLTEPSAVLAELNEIIEDDIFSALQSKGCVNYWKGVRDNLTEHQYSEYISWSNIEKFESIHYLEAIFLLLNLPTRFLLEHKEFNLYDSPYSNNCSDSDAREVFINTIECQALERSHQDWISDDPYGESRGNNFDVSSFIEWSLKKGFIEELDSVNKEELNNNHLGKYNDYRGWAKVHNTIASLVALELYEGKLDSVSSILNDKTFYEKLSKKLAPKTQDGKDKPKPHTLENYISGYNNFNK
jgi:hypothetical protein